MQEYHENENAKEAEQNLGVDEETLMAPLSSMRTYPRQPPLHPLR